VICDDDSRKKEETDGSVLNDPKGTKLSKKFPKSIIQENTKKNTSSAFGCEHEYCTRKRDHE
jgi:hypothetical protein